MTSMNINWKSGLSDNTKLAPELEPSSDLRGSKA